MWLMRSSVESRRVRSSTIDSPIVTAYSPRTTARMSQPKAPCHSYQASPQKMTTKSSERRLCSASSVPAHGCRGKRSRHSCETIVSTAPSAACSASRQSSAVTRSMAQRTLPLQRLGDHQIEDDDQREEGRDAERRPPSE